ncbi:Maf family protein [Salinibacter altiplanensis]|uniref:Maf family protein n=1 Tax=Salinibacter altiplanensis TaxID=1803181 RepID=UPI000C9F373E|nr:Maf family protein [Salinibacter altiplanensis]
MNPLLQLSCPLLLASQSPRRRALLDRIDVPFEAEGSPADETLETPGTPAEAVRTLARRKAHPVAADRPSALVLAADTVVAHDGDILQKPDDSPHARAMLHRLQDTAHTVHTGLALMHAASERTATAVESTGVALGPLSDTEIQAYVASGSPLDKAGGYGIQDHTAPFFVEGIEGDYYNVVGLPLHRLYCMLHESFADLLQSPSA